MGFDDESHSQTPPFGSPSTSRKERGSILVLESHNTGEVPATAPDEEDDEGLEGLEAEDESQAPVDEEPVVHRVRTPPPVAPRPPSAPRTRPSSREDGGGGDGAAPPARSANGRIGFGTG